MSYQPLFVTHVEISANHFIKIHGQTNRSKAEHIDRIMPTVINIFATFPTPELRMLLPDSMVLVYYSNRYFRGKFMSFDERQTANVLLIDQGYTVNIELDNLRMLNLAPGSEFMIKEPALAQNFILNRCIIYNENSLLKIRNDILGFQLPYTIDDEIGNIKRISLVWNGRDYTDHLVNSKVCQAITADSQKKFLTPKTAPLSAARPVNKASNNNATATARSSINATGMQMQLINSHLGIGKVPQNMPSFQPRVPPSLDFNLNHRADKSKSLSPAAITNEQQHAAHYIPTFMSDTLIMNGQHQVYVPHVDDGPYMFSIQLKSSEQKMQQMMDSIAKCPLTPLSRKPALGMVCLARFSVDNGIYRAVIKSINNDSCQMLYVDYGNSETVPHNNIYDIPEEFLRLKTFAIRVSLAGLSNLPALSDSVKAIFNDMVVDKTLDMVVVPPDGKVFVQCCELSINGEKMLNRLKDILSEVPKFIEPTTLQNDEHVVIRYVESPKLFCVQQTKNIRQYDEMMDKLCHYCLSASPLKKLQNGIACAARFKNDTEYYRAEIVDVSGSDALIRFVDYGIELKTEVNALKEISYDFLIMPKQAVRCCLLGFESMQTFSNLSQDQMELLAEDSIGERRNFRVKIYAKMDDAILVNLIDESHLPSLNLSMRMLQLSMPQKAFRQYELRHQNKAPTTIPRSIHVGDGVDQQINATLSDKATSDSGFQDCASTSTRISNWNTPDRDNRTNARNTVRPDNYRDDSGVGDSSLGSPEVRQMNVKESKFYKNMHPSNTTQDSNGQRNIKPYISSNLRNETLTAEGPIDPNSEIPTERIPLNSSHQVKLSWCFSPLDFYVITTKSDADLDYTTQMKDIHHFYKNKSPVTKKIAIGSLAIVRYNKDNQLHRAKIIDYNDKVNKYKAQLIDVGALTIVLPSDIFEMDKIFAKLECQAIRCSFSGVALRASRFDLEEAIEKLMDDKVLTCKFIKKKADTFYVDIHVNGLNVKDVLIRDKFLSILPEDVDIERLVGQTVMAQIESVKDLSSFQIAICGCATTFEASCPKSTDKKLPKGVTIPIRIDSLLPGKTFSVTPLLDIFGEKPASTICPLSFFSNHFKAYVMHWESYNTAYVQSDIAHGFVESLLANLFDFYETNGDLLQEFVPQTFCAAKSADENWYRAEIISETQSNEVNVRYLDYGNCEAIPKNLVKRLEPKFCETAALAVKVYLPLQRVYSDRETSVEENIKLTADIPLDLRVLDFYAQNWIVDLLKGDVSITSAIKTKNSCKTMGLEELKKQIADMEMVQKATRLQIEKQQRNDRDVNGLSSVTIVSMQSPAANSKVQSPTVVSNKEVEAVASQNVHLTTQQPTTQQPTTQQPTTQQPTTQQPTTQQPTTQQPTTQQSQSKNSSKTKAYISHIDRPDRFYLQLSSINDDLDRLQADIQIVAPSLPLLEDFSEGTRCIVRYSVDDQWYRATIIDSDTKITSILFIDYGNTDTITDNTLIRSMIKAFDKIPAYAIPCALPLEAKDRIEWSDESCDVLKNLVDTELEFEYVCKGKANNLVKLHHGDRDVMQELIQSGYAIKIESITTGSNCYMSHVNSISDFYIQMEGDTDALEKVADYLLDVSKFETMTDIKDGVVCAAKYSDDGLWYRAKILSHKGDSTEVFFVDYGNTSLTNELRIIPIEIANAPSLAKYCSMVKPKDIQYWSDSAERRFVELTDNGAIFRVDVVSPGKKSVVNLSLGELSVMEEISNLCDKYSLSALEKTLQSNANVTEVSEPFLARIVDGSPSQFYIQKEIDSDALDKLWLALEVASTWPALKEIVVGRMCAALYDGVYYRAKIVSLGEHGAIVHYVDYGNQSFSGDLRELPEELQRRKHLAIGCCLESKYGTFSAEMVERFEKLSKDVPFEVRYVTEDSNPAIVQLFVDGVKFEEGAVTTAKPKIKAFISEMIAPNRFYIQLNNDMDSALTSASEFPLLDESHKRAGKRCAAFWEEAFYRAEILAVDENGIKVHFIDYGNESYATDLRQLPEDLEKIERASMLCTLASENDSFTSDFVHKFTSLDLDAEYEFDVMTESSPRVVRLYVNGELFADGNLDSKSEPKNGQSQANSDSISIVNGNVDGNAIGVIGSTK